MTAIAAMLAVASLSGCASIVNGVNQPISVETRLNGEPLVGAACKLSSNKGTWFVNTPGSVTVHRGFQDLVVECTKSGVPTSNDLIASSVKGMAFGNLLFGGLIGVAVDSGNGAAFDYPELITIDMSRHPSAAADEGATTAVRIPASALPTASPTPAPTAAVVAASPTAATPPPSTSPMPAPTPVVAAAVAKSPAEALQPPLVVQSPVVTPRVTLPVTPTPLPAGGHLRYLLSAEQLTRDRCPTKTESLFIAAGPGWETYSITCAAAETLIVRCDFGACRELH